MTTAVLDEDLVLDQAVASGHEDRRRVLRDCGHQLRAARRRSTLSGLKPAFARSACREHGRRAVGPESSQVTSGVYDDSAGTDGGLSCLANGTTKPISDVKIGDSVLATDPSTGRTEAKAVTAVMAHDDTDLMDVTVKEADGQTGVIHTNAHHVFWDQTRAAWLRVDQLGVGDGLTTANGVGSTIAAITPIAGHERMWDLTIAGVHTFYVESGAGAVLVHNSGSDFKPGTFVNDHGVKISIHANDHPPPHAHVTGGNGEEVRIGQNGKPLAGDPELSATQQEVVDEHLSEIRNQIGDYMDWFANGCR